MRADRFCRRVLVIATWVIAPLAASAQPGADLPAPAAPPAPAPPPAEAPAPEQAPAPAPDGGGAPGEATMAPGAQLQIEVRDPMVLQLARGAHAAGARGDCLGARVLSERIRKLDPAYHRVAIASDPVIASCRPAPPRNPDASPPSDEAVHHEAESAPLLRREGTPPLSGGAVAGELLLGGVFAAGGGFLGAYIGYGLEDTSGCDELCGLGGLFLGGLVGMTVAAPLGVMIAGDTDTVEGSTAGAFAGSVLGSLIGVGLLVKSEGGGGALLMTVAAPAIGATLGYNLGRRYKPQRVNVSLTPTPMPVANGFGLSLASGSF